MPCANGRDATQHACINGAHRECHTSVPRRILGAQKEKLFQTRTAFSRTFPEGAVCENIQHCLFGLLLLNFSCQLSARLKFPSEPLWEFQQERTLIYAAELPSCPAPCILYPESSGDRPAVVKASALDSRLLRSSYVKGELSSCLKTAADLQGREREK